jgi:hypothetical protein
MLVEPGLAITHRVVWRLWAWDVAWFGNWHGSIRLEISEFAARKRDR